MSKVDKDNDKNNNGIDIPDRYIVDLQGKQFILFNGLIHVATEMGYKGTQVDIIQFPEDKNQWTAICKATAIDKNGNIFSDIGDANKSTCSNNVAKHYIRMASTRSIARVLRSLTNIGMTAYDELNHDDNNNIEPPNKEQKIIKLKTKTWVECPGCKNPMEYKEKTKGEKVTKRWECWCGCKNKTQPQYALVTWDSDAKLIQPINADNKNVQETKKDLKILKTDITTLYKSLFKDRGDGVVWITEPDLKQMIEEWGHDSKTIEGAEALKLDLSNLYKSFNKK